MTEAPSILEPFGLPCTLGSLRLPNRFVMAPMTRLFCPNGVPGDDVVAYYRGRAEGGVGLIVTEGTYIDHPGANGEPHVPAFHGEAALAGWRRVVKAVHAAGGLIIPQIWHYGLFRRPGVEPDPTVPGYAPMELRDCGRVVVKAMTRSDIAAVVASFARAATDAVRLGFDGVELHGAHEYLIDSFLWEETNRRTDDYGGSLENRVRFAVEVVAAVRHAVGPDFPVVFRFSQWKQRDYTAKLAKDPDELSRILRPLVAAGVDIFDVSARRFWEPAFATGTETLAAVTRRITGRPVITVGSVGLKTPFTVQDEGAAADPFYDRLALLRHGFEAGEFDLVALGRALLSEPAWPRKILAGQIERIRSYDRTAHTRLII